MYGATVGQLGYLDIEAATNQAICVLIADPEITDPRFLYYALMYDRSRLVASAQGAAQQNLSQASIREFSLRVPGLAVQRRIAKVLGSIDDLIENNRRRVDLLEQMARAIYQEWFVRFRYPGHEDTPLVDSPVGAIPEGWTAEPASRVLEINPKVTLKRGNRCRYVSMGDVDERRMTCSPSGWKDSPSGSKFENGDTLFARITPCLENGKTGFMQALADDEAACGSTEFIVLRGRLVGPCFTYLLARSADFRGHAISSMSGASGRQRVRNECFDSFTLATPPAPIAARFEDAVEPLVRHSWVLHQQASTLKCLRDLLLPKLVTGQIDVSDLDLDALTESLIA